jgi:hypothetical protein
MVIYENRESVSKPGQMATDCTGVVGDIIGSSPTCMLIKKDDKIGFANYYSNENGGKSVVIELNSTIFGVSSITLDYQQTKVLTVKKTPGAPFTPVVRFDSSSPPHGGPVMIPKE